MSDFAVKALDESTWPDFAALVERTTASGAAAGAWASTRRASDAAQAAGRRTAPRRSAGCATARRTRRSSSTATTCVGWCQFGPPDELPRIKHKRAYLAGASTTLAGLAHHLLLRRQGHRGRGVARAALEGALEEIARLGGGTVESYPGAVGGPQGLLVVPAQRHRWRCSSSKASSASANSASTTGWSERPYDEEALLLQDGAGALHSVDAAGVTQLLTTGEQVAVDDTGETARRRLGRSSGRCQAHRAAPGCRRRRGQGPFGDQPLTRSGKWEPLASAQSDYAALQSVIWPAAPTLDAAAEEKLANEFKRQALRLYKASDARKFHRERRFATVEAIFD